MAYNMRSTLNKPEQNVVGDSDSVSEQDFMTPRDPTPKREKTVEFITNKSEEVQSPREEISPQKGEVVYKQPTTDFAKEPKIQVNNITVLEENLAPRWAFFLFVNPTSGGNKAATLTKLDVEKFTFSNFGKMEVYVELSIFNLKDSKSKMLGLTNLKKSLNYTNVQTRVIVGGGDGTIMWVIEEMIKAEIPFTNCPIGCIPFGTGNDFSRVLGWGGEEPSVLIGTHLNNLKGMIADWMEAMPEDFDIWDISIETFEEGGIRKIEKEDGKKFQKKFLQETDPHTGAKRNVSKFNKKMCNYFSFGIDARIGYGFDKSRTHSRGLNKMVYCWEGAKKMMINTLKVNHILHRVEDHKEEEEDVGSPDTKVEEGDENHKKSIDKIEYGRNGFLLYPSSQNKNERPPHSQVIKGNPSVFLCLNIPSYMGGASNPWAASKGKSGVTDYQNKLLNNFDDQMFGDGKLEIISFSGPLSLAMERFFKGQGRRVGQAEGPFNLNFKRSDNPKKPIKTYIQVDGEFFQLVAPKCIKLTLAKDLPNGKVRVMKNKDFHLQQMKEMEKRKRNKK